LTAKQRPRLVSLEQAWSKESRGLDRAVTAARAGFESFTREAGARGVSVAEIQRQSPEYRELCVARERHAEVAQAVLTEAQRQCVARGRFTSVPGGER
jgi:hypothetical protein